MIGNHTPRRCGIATFTTDLATAISNEVPGIDCQVLAMNEPGRRHVYPARVSFEIDQADIASYRRAADFLNLNAVDVVSVQHEYGIFGGKAGVLLLALLRELRMPFVTTLHTILSDPNPMQRAVMDELASISERLVCMSNDGARLLSEVHRVDPYKVDVIPHGIPSLPASRRSKDKLGVEGNDVVLTFGLLSPDKGIEHVIDALPAVLARYPNTLYIVLGATHPHIKEREGEAYRIMLEARAKRLGVDSNIIFHDRFVTHEELVEFLSAADIYITPYLKAEQITSGTLAYAVGSGKAVISTPYRYARELLDDGRGILVPWKDSEAIAREIVGLLADSSKRLALQERAAAHGRTMTWPVVARGYLKSFDRSRRDHTNRMSAGFKARTIARRPPELPEVDLTHLRLMTDDTGMLQHAAFSVPRYSDGYCLDDNARALICVTLLGEAGVEPPKAVRVLASKYLAFVNHAFDPQSGRFRNFLSYSRQWLEDAGSDDSHGRALWALGVAVGRSPDHTTETLSGQLFHAALRKATDFTSPRAWAYALLGIDEYLRAFQGESGVESVRSLLTEKLLGVFRATSGPEWPWFEDRLTYCNARLSQALIVSGARMKHEEATTTGLSSLDWLCSVQTVDGYFTPIGSNGFYVRGGPRAIFDQQPVEASATISACLDAYRVTSELRWATRAHTAFGWFLGQNHLQLPLYDSVSGGCRDGLHADRPNQNQGAESTLSFLLALLEMRVESQMATAHARSTQPTVRPLEELRGTAEAAS